MFNIIKGWANWDAEHQEIVATVSTLQEANQQVEALKDKHGLGVYFAVRPASSPVTAYVEYAPSRRD